MPFHTQSKLKIKFKKQREVLLKNIQLDKWSFIFINQSHTVFTEWDWDDGPMGTEGFS